MKLISNKKFKELQLQEKLINLVTPKTTDTTEFDEACTYFKQVCKKIGELINDPNFKGGFDDMLRFEMHSNSNTSEGLRLAISWQAADKLCTYTASKLGYGQPEWWKRCWNII